MCATCEAVAAALHTAEAESADKVEEITDASVRIAEIEANKEITLAKIHAGVDKAAVTAETDAELVEAKTEAAVLGEVVDSLTPDPEPPPAAPVVVVNDDQADEPDPMALPPVEEHHEEPKSPAKPRGFFG